MKKEKNVSKIELKTFSFIVAWYDVVLGQMAIEGYKNFFCHAVSPSHKQIQQKIVI